MKTQFKLFSTLLFSFIYISVQAQAPNIAYNPANYNLTFNTTISPIAPINSGGSVPANVYSTVSTFAGNAGGAAGTANGSLTAARFNTPRWTTIDYTNKLMYVADAGNNTIRKIDLTTNTVSLYAGTGTPGGNNGPIATATFNAPYAITYDGSGALYVVDFGTNSIRKIVVSTGTVSTIATGLNGPAGIVYDPVSASLYVASSGGNTILKMSTTGSFSVYAGSGTATLTNGTGTAAAFNQPNGITTDGSGNIYVADQLNNVIRKIAPGAVVTTFASGFNSPRGVDMDISGNLYVSDNGNLIYLVTPDGTVTTIAGDGTPALLNGVGTAAEFNQSRGVSVYKTTGDIYVSDYSNNVIRKIIGTGYFITPTLSAGLSFNQTTGTISGKPTARFATTTYNVMAFNASGSSMTTINLGCGQTINWTGNSNGASRNVWLSTANWNPAVIPTSADNVQIGVVAYSRNNQPTLNGSTTVNSITFGTNNAPALTITGGTLTVNSSLTVNTASTITITGGTTGAIAMAPTSIINLNGTGKLALTFTSGNFTLQSDATGSASIGPILIPANLTGSALSNISVERYVTGGSPNYRSYRLMSSPVYAAVTGGNKVYNLDYIKASSLVTGAAGGGFDRTGNASLYLFRENIAPSNSAFGAGNWPGVSKINGTPSYNLQLNGVATNYYLMSGSGFLFFFRGDRTTNLPNKYTPGTSAESVTFTATGILNVGQVIAKDWYTPTSSNLGFTTVAGNSTVQGFNLVGNPYPSNIDWDTFQSSTSTSGIYGVFIDGTMYMLDPVSKNYGTYLAGSGGIGTDNATNIIPSGAGFFVRASSASSQLFFNESAKTSSQVIGPNLMLGQPVASAPLQYLRLKMLQDSINTDETMIRIKNNGGANFIEGLDAIYKPGTGTVSLASRSGDQVDIAIKSIILPKQQAENVMLDVNATTNGIYQLTLRDIVSIPRLYDVWLMDNYKRDSLDMRQNKTYSFYINKSDSTTFGTTRFYLVIRQNEAYAYRLLDFTAKKLADARQVQAVWTTANEENYTNFTVERSNDNGATFTVLGGVTATGAGTYSFTDKNAAIGTNLYRLKQEDINNTVTYSKIVTIQYSNLSNNLVGHNLGIYPNPGSSVINLSIVTQNNTASIYKIRFMNSSGLLIKEATSSQPTWQGSISNLQPGTYIIQVFDNKTQNLIGENKFVKL